MNSATLSIYEVDVKSPTVQGTWNELMSKYSKLEVGEYHRINVLWTVVMLGGWDMVKELLEDHEKVEDQVRLLISIQRRVDYDGLGSWPGSAWRHLTENKCARSAELRVSLLSVRERTSVQQREP